MLKAGLAVPEQLSATVLSEEHARQGGFPANRISEIKAVIDPTTAEG